MKTSLNGVIEIASHEGIVLMPYRDSVGVWTFGIGHTAAAGEPIPAMMDRGVARPVSEAVKVFQRDLAKYEHRVNDAVKVPLKQHEFDALVSFDFNTGGIYRAKLTAALNAGDRVGAAAKFMGWKKPPEIIPRRKKEQALFRDGTYSSGGMANVYTASAGGKVNWGSARRVNVAKLLGEPAPEPVPPPPDVPPPEPDTKPAIQIEWGAIALMLSLAVVAFVAAFSFMKG